MLLFISLFNIIGVLKPDLVTICLPGSNYIELFKRKNLSNNFQNHFMKGMIYRDGKFISVLSDVDASSLYEELPRRKKARQLQSRRKNKISISKKRG